MAAEVPRAGVRKTADVSELRERLSRLEPRGAMAE
jgi:hypothetical protein